MQAVSKSVWTLPGLALGLALLGLASLFSGPAVASKKEPVACYISERKINRENTRINCIYKCPDGRSEREVVPRSAQCPSKIEVTR